jgi:hypothetical protein
MSQPQSTLARFAPLCREAQDIDARRMAREAYHEDPDLVLIRVSWLANWPEKQQLRMLADKIHGKAKA